MESNFAFVVQRTNAPDDGLGAVGHDGYVQFVASLERTLVGYDAVAVHHSCVQESYRACVFLVGE